MSQANQDQPSTSQANQMNQVIDLTGEETKQAEKRHKMAMDDEIWVAEQEEHLAETEETRIEKNKALYRTANLLVHGGPPRMSAPPTSKQGTQTQAMLDRLRKGEDPLPEDKTILSGLARTCMVMVSDLMRAAYVEEEESEEEED